MSAEAKLAEVGRKGRAFEEVGSTGINYWRQGASGKGQYVQISEDFLSALRGTTGIKVYTEMSENDPIIGGIVMMFEQLLKQIPWYVDPVDKTDQAKKDAEFVAQCKDDMTHTWSEFVDEALTFLIYGWSWHEIVYKMRDGKKSRYSDGKIGWRKFAPRAQSSFDSWEFDESGELIGMQQNPPPAYKLRHLPLEVGGIQKSIHFMTLSRKRNPEGRSVLRNAYRPWYFKKRLEELEGIGIERDLTGMPMLTPPENVDLEDARHDTTRAWAQKLIRNIRRGHQEGFIKPFGWEFQLVPSPGKHPIEVGAVVSRYDKAIALSCLAQFLMLGMERVGSYAMAESSQQLFDRCLDGWAYRMTDILNAHAIPSLFKINGWKRDEYPTMTTGSVARESLKDLASYVNRLGVAGFMDNTDEDLRLFLRRYGPLKDVGRGKAAASSGSSVTGTGKAPPAPVVPVTQKPSAAPVVPVKPAPVAPPVKPAQKEPKDVK